MEFFPLSLSSYLLKRHKLEVLVSKAHKKYLKLYFFPQNVESSKKNGATANTTTSF